MFSTNKELSVNEKKDFKKLSNLMKRAVGHNTIAEFANECGIPNSSKQIADIIYERISFYPEVGFLKKIALGSDLRVSFDDLRIACGYSLNDDHIDLKNIKVLRGWICMVNYGNVIDSEQGGIRPSLVIQNDMGNSHAGITMVIPLSSRIGKNKMPTHIRIGQESGLLCESEILIEQMRVVSKRRLLIDGFVQVKSECPENILRKVEIAIMKQTGIVNTRLNESVVDRFLEKLDEYSTKVENNYNYNHGYNYDVKPRMVCV